MSKKRSTPSDATKTGNSSTRLVEPLDGNDKGRVRLFVYGSLKRGHHNNGLLSRADASFMGPDTITGPFRMVSLGGFPGVVYDDRIEGATTIFGEVYHFAPSRLETFDWLEGYPRFYGRSKLRTDFMDKKVWMYHLPYEPYATRNDTVRTGIWNPTESEVAFWADKGVRFREDQVIYD